MLVKAGQRNAQHSLHGTPKDDGGGAAVHLRGDFEDGQSAGIGFGGRNHGGLSSGLEAGAEGGGRLSRRLQEVTASVGGRNKDCLFRKPGGRGCPPHTSNG